MEWIKVEDKLPEVTEMVIVFGSFEKGSPKISYPAIFVSKYNHFVFHEVTLHNITHWMPLPEPPHQPKLTWQYELKSEPGVWKDATDDEYKAGCDLIRLNWKQVEK